MNRVITFLLLVGDSGAGKNHILKMVEKDGYKKIVSSTTRKPRKDEVHGIDYYFLTDEDFDSTNMIETNNIYSIKYGIAKETFLHDIKDNDRLVAIVEPSGLLSLLEYLDTASIVPNIKEMFDVKIIYLDTPEELRFARIVKDLESSNDERLSSVYRDAIYTESGNDVNVLNYPVYKEAFKRMGRFPKDMKGYTIFDRIFDNRHEEHNRLKFYLDPMYCTVHVYNPITNVGTLNEFLIEKDIIGE